MDERPQSADPVRQKGRILVVRRHDDAISLKLSEVLRQRQRNSGTTFGVRGEGHCILLQLWNVSDTRIFDAPKLFWILIWIRHQGWCWIDLPSVHTVRRTRGAEMRETAAILHPAKQQRRAILQQRCSGVKHAIDPIRPVLTGQDWIGGMPMKERVGRIDRMSIAKVIRYFTVTCKLIPKR